MTPACIAQLLRASLLGCVFLAASSGAAFAQEAGEGGAELLVVGEPGVAAVEVALDAQAGPVLRLLPEQVGDGLGHRAQRVAGEVDAGLGAAEVREGELGAEGGEGVGGVKLAGEGLGGLEVGHGPVYGPWRPRKLRAAPARRRWRSASEMPVRDSMMWPGRSSPRGKG